MVAADQAHLDACKFSLLDRILNVLSDMIPQSKRTYHDELELSRENHIEQALRAISILLYVACPFLNSHF